MKDINEYLWLIILLATTAIEILIRLKPTAKAIGIIQTIINIINYLIPNKVKKK
jgi:hypothetical protein